VSDGRFCEFTRVLDWGGSSLDVALARALNATPGEVAPLKRALDLDGSAPAPEGVDEGVVAKARDIVLEQINVFARELVSSLHFYQSQPDSLEIGEIVLTGGGSHLAGLASQLEQLTGVTVRVGDPLSRVQLKKNLETADPVGSLAVAIGLGIED
jgi:type IV pilus assembly protein PilM